MQQGPSHTNRALSQAQVKSSPQSPIHSRLDPADSDDGHQSGDDDLDDSLEPGRPNKRKRPISVSCELCKQRKVKCDRGQPSCGWCSRNGALCEYKERKKPGLRAGYGRELEQRLDKLEAQMKGHAELLQLLTGGTSTGESALASITVQPVTTASVKGSHTSQSSEHETPRDTSSSKAFGRPPDPTRTPQAEAALFVQKRPSIEVALSSVPSHDALYGMSPQTHAHTGVPLSAAAQEYFGTRTPSLQSPPTVTAATATATAQNSTPARPSSDQDLPPYDLLFALVDLYFKHINTWCPILHRKSTVDSLFAPSMIDDADSILLNAIVATTLRYSQDPRLTSESRKRYHDAAKQRVLLYGMDHLSVKSLQALVILALDLCGSSNGPPGWNIMALITRAVVQLGLAVESNSFSVAPSYKSIYTLRAMILPEPYDFIEEESRRRLFWMVYLLDRYATIATAFEFALDDRDIDRMLPCRDDLWFRNQKVETRWFRAKGSADNEYSRPPGASPTEDEVDRPENLGAFSYYVEILGILSNIHKFLKQPVDIGLLAGVEMWQHRYKQLDTALTAWKFNLPGDYGNMAKLFQPGSAKTLNCGWIMLHATYHTAVMRLHSSAAYPTTRSPIFTPSFGASQRCHQAVETVMRLAEFVVTHNLLVKLGPPFAFTLWVAARVLLVHGSTVERKLNHPQIAFFVDTLRDMGQWWPVAARYCSLLTRVLDEHGESERRGGGETPNSVKILADMRRTAFDLDFLISRQPRHATGMGGLPHAAGGANGGVNNGLGPGTGGGGGNGGFQSRFPSVTPVRTPAPNELEYLDVFDFFNMPRLALAPGTNDAAGGGGPGNGLLPTVVDGCGTGGAVSVISAGEFNINDFMVDANRDWLFPQ